MWEYAILHLPDDWRCLKDALNEYGKVGWELVAVTREIAYFKRPIPHPAQG
jgi:hypothetical protein